MSHSKTTESKVAPTKKDARKEVSELLANALGNLKETLGTKKFERRIKKAARLLTAGIKTKPVKKEKKAKGKPKPGKVKAVAAA